MFSPNGANGPELKTTRMFRLVRQVAAPGPTSAASDYILFGIEMRCCLVKEKNETIFCQDTIVLKSI